MKTLLLVLGILAVICSSAMAGKNQGGALVVHVHDGPIYSPAPCTYFNTYYSGLLCPDLDTRADTDEATVAVIWFIAAFPPSANPGVQVIYFGNEHNLPANQGYHANWGLCGPAGSFELPDAGWPEAPATAGNSLAFSTPVVGDLLFPFYYFSVYGFAGAFYCTDINPVGGYASFEDDSNPPQTDTIDSFGCVRWYQAGYNECPSVVPPLPGACCFRSGACSLADDEADCLAEGGYIFMGAGTVCVPNPCPQPGACCFEDGHCEYSLEAECTGDVWYGGLDCDPNPCPPLLWACCFENGDCTYVPLDQCDGTPWGYGIDCDPNPCPQPSGACCAEDGTCTVTTEADCAEYVWIPDTDCDPNPCPPIVLGACCYGCQECAVLSEADCVALPDDYQWIESEDCDPNPCPPVVTETTTWGTIKAVYK